MHINIFATNVLNIVNIIVELPSPPPSSPHDVVRA